MILPRSLDELEGRRAAHWGRESSGRQAERFGPAAQREQRVGAIAAYGMLDTGIEWQVAHSGRTIGSTSQFTDMLARAGRDFDVLVVGYNSRFARNLRTAVNARHQLHEAGAAIFFADERVLSSDESAWGNWARETVEAEAYSRRLARSVHTGYAAKIRDYADQGGGLVPVGFRRVGDRKLIEPDPETMPRAVAVWELAAQGAADGTIAAEIGLSLWTVRGILRSPLYAGRLHDGRPTRFSAPVDAQLVEQAYEFRRSRTRIGNRLRRNRTYPLSGSGPAVCAACERPIKGDTRTRRDGTKLSVYRHADTGPCPVGRCVKSRAPSWMSRSPRSSVALPRTARVRLASEPPSSAPSWGPIASRLLASTPGSAPCPRNWRAPNSAGAPTRSSRRSRTSSWSANGQSPSRSTRGWWTRSRRSNGSPRWRDSGLRRPAPGAGSWRSPRSRAWAW